MWHDITSANLDSFPCGILILLIPDLILVDPSGGRFAERQQVLQRFRCEHSNDAIGTRAEESLVRHMKTKGASDLDVHPLDELASFIIYVDMPISCKCENFLVVNRYPHKDLKLNLGEVCCLRFYYAFFLIWLPDSDRLTCLWVQ